MARRGLWTALAIIAAIGLSLFALSRTDFGAEGIAGLLEQIQPGWLVAAVTTMTGGFWFLGLRWKALMPVDHPIPTAPLAAILVVATLLHYAVPGPLGEVAAAALAARRVGVPGEMAFAANIHARLIGLGMAGVMAGVLFLVAPLPVDPQWYGWIGLATGLIATGAMSLAAISARPTWIVAISRHTFGRVRWLAKVHASALRFADALGRIGHLGPRRWALAAFWAVCGHSCVIVGIGIACVGMGVVPNLAGLVFTYAMATAGAIVLFAFPGSQAGWDAAFMTLLVATAGVPKFAAAAVTLTVRLQQIGLILLGAIALLAGNRDGNATSKG